MKTTYQYKLYPKGKYRVLELEKSELLFNVGEKKQSIFTGDIVKIILHPGNRSTCSITDNKKQSVKLLSTTFDDSGRLKDIKVEYYDLLSKVIDASSEHVQFQISTWPYFTVLLLLSLALGLTGAVMIFIGITKYSGMLDRNFLFHLIYGLLPLCVCAYTLVRLKKPVLMNKQNALEFISAHRI